MIYAFRDCVFDEDRCELQRAGKLVALQPKATELLAYLLRHRERVVEKEELLDALWPGTAVTEGSLTRAVNLVRSAVGDAGSEQAVVRTVPRRGYRFCAPVELRSTGGALAEEVVLARERYAARDWAGVLERLERARGQGVALEAEDLERRAWAIRWSGSPDDAFDAFAAAEAAYAEAGDRKGLARMVLQMARHAYEQADRPLATALMTRAQEALEDLPECREHGTLTWLQCRGLMELGQTDAALALAERTRELGQRLGCREFEALGLTERGHILQARGEAAEATTCHDQAFAAAMSGELDVQDTGTIYCSTHWGARNRGDCERASRITERSQRWCRTAGVDHFPGLCRLHRAEVLRLRAEFEEAEREIILACDDLLIHMPMVAGDAFNEMGEIRLRRGDLAGAREAFLRAVELGHEPEPGLARLRVEEGDLEGALRGIERALRSARVFDAQRHLPILLAEVGVALAAGQRERAHEALARVEAQPGLFASVAHRAAVDGARGELALAEGRVADALALFAESRRGWLEVGAAWEAANVQRLRAEALLAEGDAGAARLELEAAQAVFERLGATLHAQRVEARLIALTARTQASSRADRSTRTFLFTDIVGSTKLAGALGDEDWELLRRWHHRTLRDCFQAHGGEIVGPHEGDGFFVAFGDAASALECAVAIQQRLAAHRREHGFAPRVRIGAHTAEAMRRGEDYAGKGVHVAARVTDAAEGGEILVTDATCVQTGDGFRFGAPRRVGVAETEEAVEARPVEWSS